MARRRCNPLNPLNPLSTPGCIFGAVVLTGAGVWAGYMWGKKAATPAGTTTTLTTTVPTTSTTTK
jgi:hypothetical protein